MFYDLEDPINFIRNIKSILKTDGILHIEVAYLPEIIRTFSYDTFCQEHYEYYSLISLSKIFEKTDMKVINFGKNEINGGSIWINVSHKKSKYKSDNNKINQQLKYEYKKNIHKISTYKVFLKMYLNMQTKLIR